MKIPDQFFETAHPMHVGCMVGNAELESAAEATFLVQYPDGRKAKMPLRFEPFESLEQRIQIARDAAWQSFIARMTRDTSAMRRIVDTIRFTD